MGNIPDPDKVLKWFHFYRKFIKPEIDEFINEPPLTERFASLYSDIREGKHPTIISEKISGYLNDELIQHFRHMDTHQYKDFAEDIMFSLINKFKWNVKAWHDKIINFENVDEIWIAYEPILDLVISEDGAYELLQKQIQSVNRIYYFLENKVFYDDLIELLKSKNIDTTKIKYQKIDQKLIQPIVLYITEDRTFGVYGTVFPDISKTTNGFYKLNKALTPDWMKYLSREDSEDYKLQLKRCLTKI